MEIGRKRDGSSLIHGFADRTDKRSWRGWLRVGGARFSLEVSARYPSTLIGFAIADDRESSLQLHLALWPVKLWFTFGPFRFLRRFDGREFIGFDVNIGEPLRGFTFTLWHDGFGPHSRGQWYGFWWVRPFDLIFGRERVTDKDTVETRVGVPLPEGVYEGRIKRTTYFRKRSRWPRGRLTLGTSFEPDKPIGVPDDPDCDFYTGEDAIYEMGVKNGTDAEVIGWVVAKVMRDRIRHGGTWAWRARERAAA